MKRNNVQVMTITAIFLAIIILQTFMPNIGYVRILPALPAITTIPLTIAIYACLMGPKYASMFGLLWGCLRLVVAYTQPGDIVSALLFRNVFISIIPSVLSGFLAALIPFFFLKFSDKVQHIGYILSGGMAAFTNTLFVILLTTLFFISSPQVLTGHMSGVNTSQSLFIILIGALGMNSIAEIIFTAVVTPLIVIPMKKVLLRRVGV